MKKLLTATGAAVVLTNMTLAPAFANSLAQQTTPRQQQQVVLPEGEMMSDAELAQVEGEWKWIAAAAVVGGGFQGYNEYQNCVSAGRQDCWTAAASGAANGALTWGTTAATFGRARGFGGGAYGR
jgi:hypothetical protein